MLHDHLPLVLAFGIFSIPASHARADYALKGSWVVVAAEQDGKPADHLKGHVLSFAGNRFTITEDGKMIYQGTFSQASEQKPATFDFIHAAGLANGKTWKGIYVIDGEALKMCDNAPNLSRSRPTTFAAAAGSGYVSLTFKRLAK
jgi:uncharacterized protein (TIGR03067 family)